jgi:hypothetical protein
LATTSRRQLALPQERLEVLDKMRHAGARLGEIVSPVHRAAHPGRKPIRPALDRLDVLGGCTEQDGDHHRGQREREFPDEVHLASIDDGFEESIDGGLDAVAALVQLARSEEPLQQRSQPVVVRRVPEHEPLREHVAHGLHGWTLARVLRVDLAEAVRREPERLLEDLEHLRESGHRPGAEARAPVHRVVVAQPAIEREGVLYVGERLQVELSHRSLSAGGRPVFASP